MKPYRSAVFLAEGELCKCSRKNQSCEVFRYLANRTSFLSAILRSKQFQQLSHMSRPADANYANTFYYSPPARYRCSRFYTRSLTYRRNNTEYVQSMCILLNNFTTWTLFEKKFLLNQKELSLNVLLRRTPVVTKLQLFEKKMKTCSNA